QALGKPLARGGSPAQISLAPSGDSALVLRSTGEGELWTQLPAGPVSFPLEPAVPLAKLEFSPVGRQFHGVTRGTNVMMWETGSRLLHFTLPLHAPAAHGALAALGPGPMRGLQPGWPHDRHGQRSSGAVRSRTRLRRRNPAVVPWKSRAGSSIQPGRTHPFRGRRGWRYPGLGGE